MFNFFCRDLKKNRRKGKVIKFVSKKKPKPKYYQINHNLNDENLDPFLHP